MRLVGVTVVAAVATALAGPGVPAAAAPAVPVASSVRSLLADPVDLTALHAEALQVLTRDYQAGVDQASAALTGADGQEQSATASLSRDEASVNSATSQVAADTETLATTTVAHAAAVTAHAAAVTELAEDQERLGQIAVALYMGPPPPVPDVTADLSGAETSADGSLYLTTGDHELTAAISADHRSEASTAADATRLGRQQSADSQALTGATAGQQQAQGAVAGDHLTLAAAEASATKAQTALTAAEKAMTAAVSAFGAPAADGSPTIMGTAAMVPAQLAGWFATSGDNDLTAASPAQLAAWYVSEGGAEGVRGDVAFAQAIVETGGFSSPDATTRNNYAGIGHCDSCAAGLAFPNPQGGVRGQVQLLRIFASPAGTPLTQPAIIPQVAPTSQSDSGCCDSWQSLTGRWATATDYGQVVLTVYQRILDYALSQPPIVPGSPQAGDDPTAAGAAGTSPSTTVAGG